MPQKRLATRPATRRIQTLPAAFVLPSRPIPVIPQHRLPVARKRPAFPMKRLCEAYPLAFVPTPQALFGRRVGCSQVEWADREIGGRTAKRM